jgi:4-hydroxy-3-methylbut-2-enyl diphosphate reductase
VKIELTPSAGFCFGVKRAISILEKYAAEHGPVETLGAVVHNRQVLDRLADQGIGVADSIDRAKGKNLAIGAHGVGPETARQISNRGLTIIDTTCRCVHRAQLAGAHLAKDGFFVVVYGDAEHAEVKGILGWAEGKGLATKDTAVIRNLKPVPRRIGVLAQTTSIPEDFAKFVARLVPATLTGGTELHIVDTICPDIRRRQTAARKLAGRVDLMLVVGDRTSANTNRLVELCGKATETRLVETADDIRPGWLRGRESIGVAGGASTAMETIQDVIMRLHELCPDKP